MIHTEHILLNRPENEIFDYLKKEENHPKWGVNFMQNHEKTPEGHFVDTPMGRVKLEIEADPNTGVIDIILGGRPTPSRLFPIGKNRTLYSFTLILPKDMPAVAINQGIKGLQKEMQILKTLIES